MIAAGLWDVADPADPAESIAAAWQVLDEMVWRVGTADIRLDMEDYGRGAGTAGRAERAVWVTIGEHTAVGPAPLAICRAALKALSG
jgi:hypothetical protein